MAPGSRATGLSGSQATPDMNAYRSMLIFAAIPVACFAIRLLELRG